MNRFQRVQQWVVMARQWHTIDAKWQNVDIISKCIAAHLLGKHKPIYHPETDCGDHVVVVNSRHIAMNAFDWKRVEYYYDKEYPRARANIPAWKIHEADPKRILWLEVYRNLSFDKVLRKRAVERLHIFSDEQVPDLILKNVSNQIRQVNSVPKRIDQVPNEERHRFPALFDLPKHFIVNDHESQLD